MSDNKRHTGPLTNWEQFKERLAKHQRELEALGVADWQLLELETKMVDALFAKVPTKPTEE